jgi:uncharacterized membrane protein YphA (DoxX/SURF4 family)
MKFLVGELLPRLLVASVFLIAAYGKLRSPETLESFVKEVRAYGLFPTILSNPIAYVVPWLEGGAAVLLLLGVWRPEMRLIIGGLLVMFIAMKSYVLSQGITLECGCVPKDSFLYPLFNGWAGVGTNVGLIGLLLVEGGFARARLGAAKRCRQPNLTATTEEAHA